MAVPARPCVTAMIIASRLSVFTSVAMKLLGRGVR
jgi:hypothetical protein